MRTINILRTITTVVMLAAPLALHAQRRTTARPAAAPMIDRSGYSFSLGLGGGSNALSCGGCVSTRETGASGYLRVGKGMTPSVMAGVELNGWNKSENQGTARTSMLSAIGQYYPSLTNGFFAKSGVGIGRTTLQDNSTAPSSKLQSTGFGYQFGVGYDMSIARRWSITPYVNYLATAGANAQLDGVDMNEKLNANYVQYGLGLSWR